MPNSTFMERQVWMAALLQVCCPPRRPVAAASQIISGSNQIKRRASTLERFIAGRPVPGPAGQGCGSAQAEQLPRWTRDMSH